MCVFLVDRQKGCPYHAHEDGVKGRYCQVINPAPKRKSSLRRKKSIGSNLDRKRSFDCHAFIHPSIYRDGGNHYGCVNVLSTARLRGYTMGAPSHHHGAAAASTSSSVCEDNAKEGGVTFAWSCCGARSKDNKVCQSTYMLIQWLILTGRGLAAGLQEAGAPVQGDGHGQCGHEPAHSN